MQAVGGTATPDPDEGQVYARVLLFPLLKAEAHDTVQVVPGAKSAPVQPRLSNPREKSSALVGRGHPVSKVRVYCLGVLVGCVCVCVYVSVCGQLKKTFDSRVLLWSSDTDAWRKRGT